MKEAIIKTMITTILNTIFDLSSYEYFLDEKDNMILIEFTIPFSKEFITKIVSFIILNYPKLIIEKVEYKEKRIPQTIELFIIQLHPIIYINIEK